MKTRQIKRTFFQFLGYYLLVALLPLACIVILYWKEICQGCFTIQQRIKA